MNFTITAEAAVEPLSIEEARVHLRMLPGETEEDEAIVTPMIRAARDFAENVTGQSWARQTIVAYPDAFSRVIELPRGPVAEIVSVDVTDSEGNTKTLEATEYQLLYPDRIVFRHAPEGKLAREAPITVTYLAGDTALPMAVRQAMLLLIGHWYNNRESVVVGSYANVEVELTARTILNQYRRRFF